MRVEDELYADGIRYVSINSVAKDFGFAIDDLPRLCREGKVRTELHNGRWFVDPNSLTDHIASIDERERERKNNSPKVKVAPQANRSRGHESDLLVHHLRHFKSSQYF